MKILIADDDMGIQAMLATILKANGHEVLRSANGKLAIQILKEEDDINLVITDTDMPEADGIAILKYMLHVRYQAIKWLVSGNMNPAIAEYALELGAHAALFKTDIVKELRELRIIS